MYKQTSIKSHALCALLDLPCTWATAARGAAVHTNLQTHRGVQGPASSCAVRLHRAGPGVTVRAPCASGARAARREESLQETAV